MVGSKLAVFMLSLSLSTMLHALPHLIKDIFLTKKQKDMRAILWEFKNVPVVVQHEICSFIGVLFFKRPRCVRVMRDHTDCVVSVAFNHDRSQLISASSDQSAIVWDIVTGKQQDVLCRNKTICNAYFSWHGRYIFTYHGKERASIWDGKHGRYIYRRQSKVPNNRIYFGSTQEGRFKLYSRNHVVYLVDKTTLQPRIALRGHHHMVNDACFSSDHTHVASCSCDNTVRIWKVGCLAQNILCKD